MFLQEIHCTSSKKFTLLTNRINNNPVEFNILLSCPGGINELMLECFQIAATTIKVVPTKRGYMPLMMNVVLVACYNSVKSNLD